MLHLSNPKNEKKHLLIAENDNDMKVLHFLYDSHICFGMWSIYDKKGDKSKSCGEARFLIANFPLAAGLANINDAKT